MRKKQDKSWFEILIDRNQIRLELEGDLTNSQSHNPVSLCAFDICSESTPNLKQYAAYHAEEQVCTDTATIYAESDWIRLRGKSITILGITLSNFEPSEDGRVTFHASANTSKQLSFSTFAILIDEVLAVFISLHSLRPLLLATNNSVQDQFSFSRPISFTIEGTNGEERKYTFLSGDVYESSNYETVVDSARVDLVRSFVSDQLSDPNSAGYLIKNLLEIYFLMLVTHDINVKNILFNTFLELATRQIAITGNANVANKKNCKHGRHTTSLRLIPLLAAIDNRQFACMCIVLQESIKARNDYIHEGNATTFKAYFVEAIHYIALRALFALAKNTSPDRSIKDVTTWLCSEANKRMSEFSATHQNIPFPTFEPRH